MDIKETIIGQGGQSVTLTQANGHRVKHGVRWLRIHCKCKVCKQPFSGMYPLDATCLDDELNVKTATTTISELKCILTSSSSPEHEVTIPLDYLMKTCNCETCFGNAHSRKRPPPMSRKTVLYMDFSELDSDEGMLKCLEHIIKDGYCILRKCPVETKAQYTEATGRFGCPRTTFYGPVFDVKSVIDPVNAAYTSVKLIPHQDQHYYESSPGIQVLSVIRFDDGIQGGESQILDMLECAEILREKHPKEFETLTRVPLLFKSQSQDPNAFRYQHTKTVIDVDYFGEIVGVTWIPFTEAELLVSAKDSEAFYKAHKVFRNIIDDPKNHLLFKLEQNDFFIFNNRRMGHGRQAYKAFERAERHLYGGYVDVDDLKSNYVVLATKLGREVSAAKLGNRSCF